VAQIIDDRWQIESSIGEGGQAQTFLVTEVGSGTKAVLKRLKNPNRLPRFEQEIAAIKALDSPRVLRLIDANTTPAKPYLVSEYCEGGSLEDLKEHLRELSLDERLHLFAQICEGVAVAHAANIIHRDLKPSNIFVRAPNDLVVGDFGVCYIQTSERLTETMEAVGARFYMAPELADGRADDVTPQADIYSLGKILYWLFTGRVFDREEHRRKDRLLTNFFKEDGILHVHQLLDVMVVYDRHERLHSGADMAKNIEELRRLLRAGYPTLEHRPRLCRYCGVGTYKAIGNSQDKSAIFNFGFDSTNPPFPIIFVCQNCGHVEMFKPDYSRNPHWLGS
jgi:serine/threonine protein kinase